MTTFRGRRSSVGTSGSSPRSSSGFRRCGAVGRICSVAVGRSIFGREIMLPLVLLLALLLGTSCSSSRPGQASPPTVPAAPRPPSERPVHALSLLAKSRTDSCSICADKLRRDAFEELEQAYRPGVILASAGQGDLLRAAGDECALTLASSQDDEPTLTFRFHTASSHLVGIAETDFTDEALARQLLSISENTRLRARIQIVAYEYGDGATFLYSAANNRLQIQCKLLEVAAE